MTVRLIVYGQVQGVFFRQSAKREADKLGLVGWVRNEADGTVEVLAVGPKNQLEKFIEWCKNGPDAAKVEKVDVDWSKGAESFDGFEIVG